MVPFTYEHGLVKVQSPYPFPISAREVCPANFKAMFLCRERFTLVLRRVVGMQIGNLISKQADSGGFV
jgi:hypothetical protein